jgi:hypothetical protein
MAIEAKIDATYGDKNHTLSFILSYLFFCLLWFVFFKEDINIARSFAGFYIPARIWFDIIYNKFKGNKWDYLGSYSATDKFLKEYVPNQHIVLVARMLFSYVLFVFIGL